MTRFSRIWFTLEPKRESRRRHNERPWNLTFNDKKKAAMNPTLGRRYQYSQCDRLREPIAVDVLFAHATGGYRPGPGRRAGWQRRHGKHMDRWRIRGPSRKLCMRVQQSERGSWNTIQRLPHGAKQKPRGGVARAGLVQCWFRQLPTLPVAQFARIRSVQRTHVIKTANLASPSGCAGAHGSRTAAS